MPELVDHIDHFVLTVRSLEESCRFYEQVLGLERVDVPGKPTGLRFGAQKINLQQIGHLFEPKAAKPVAGSGDFCLIATRPIEAVVAHLNAHKVAIELGPVVRNGAQGRMLSVYFRDPDGNLVEVSHYES
jgi:catechol 2,3-dioxygenase-like lactoylglutathione lyase family enzyme